MNSFENSKLHPVDKERYREFYNEIYNIDPEEYPETPDEFLEEERRLCDKLVKKIDDIIALKEQQKNS